MPVATQLTRQASGDLGRQGSVLCERKSGQKVRHLFNSAMMLKALFCFAPTLGLIVVVGRQGRERSLRHLQRSHTVCFCFKALGFLVEHTAHRGKTKGRGDLRSPTLRASRQKRGGNQIPFFGVVREHMRGRHDRRGFSIRRRGKLNAFFFDRDFRVGQHHLIVHRRKRRIRGAQQFPRARTVGR